MNLHLVHHNLTMAAERHQRLAAQCAALAPLIKAIENPRTEPMPVEMLAQALLPFGLCVVHQHTISQARDYIASEDDAAEMSNQQVSGLVDRLNNALEAKYPRDLVG